MMESKNILTLATEIASALGGDWRVHDPTESGERSWWAALVLGGPWSPTHDLPSIHLRIHDGRLRVSPDWPMEEAGNYTTVHSPREAKAQAITLAVDRPPEKLAADIRRRLLIPYAEEFAHQRLQCDRAILGREQGRGTVERLATLLGEELSEHNGCRNHWAISRYESGRVSIWLEVYPGESPRRVKLTMSDLTEEEATQILHLLLIGREVN